MEVETIVRIGRRAPPSPLPPPPPPQKKSLCCTKFKKKNVNDSALLKSTNKLKKSE